MQNYFWVMRSRAVVRPSCSTRRHVGCCGRLVYGLDDKAFQKGGEELDLPRGFSLQRVTGMVRWCVD